MEILCIKFWISTMILLCFLFVCVCVCITEMYLYIAVLFFITCADHIINYAWYQASINVFTVSKEFKRGNLGLFLTPMLTLGGGGHIARHVWRRVIVPSDLALSFGAICKHYRYRMTLIHRAIINMYARFESTRERQLMLNKIIWWA